MEPRVWKRGRKLQLSYDLPLRVHCTHVCSTAAPNGSTVIIHGHERGVRILWRGGRRRKAPPQHTTNGNARSQDIIVLDDDEPQTRQKLEEDIELEQDEDELDPDCPFAPVIEDVDVQLGSAVLHLAVPSPASLPNPPIFFQSNVLACIACADGTNAVLTIPLVAPRDSERHEYTHNIIESQMTLNSEDRVKPIARSLAAKLLSQEVDIVTQRTSEAWSLLVGSASQTVRIDRLLISKNGLEDVSEHAVSHWPLLSPATSLSFHPSSKSSQLIITDFAGSTRIFDPRSAVDRTRPSSRDSAIEPSLEDTVQGKWIMSYANSSASGEGATDRRRQTLAARFILGGSAILALLEDGEWGVWDVSGGNKNKNISEFVLKGFLGTSPVDTSDNSKNKKRLAPMTPNTRKVKAANFFGGPSRPSGTHARGGISVVSSSLGRGGQTDESVLLWYDSEIYSIPSTQIFWQRATSHNTGGSLHSPNLTQITDINLMNEKITSVAQLGGKHSSAGLGQMNIRRDLVVSTEYRMTILEALTPPAPSKALFQAALDRPASRDQQMLDAGELDVGGMDRLLDDMAGNGARTRRVGFARS